MATVIQFRPRETPVTKPWRKRMGPADVIELTRERIERAAASHAERAKVKEAEPVPFPWFGFF